MVVTCDDKKEARLGQSWLKMLQRARSLPPAAQSGQLDQAIMALRVGHYTLKHLFPLRSAELMGDPP
jgi:hypothetical protein